MIGTRFGTCAAPIVIVVLLAGYTVPAQTGVHDLTRNTIDGDGATPTATQSCAPTGTPYCSDHCVPCPTIRENCFATACGACLSNPTCAADEVCLPRQTD